MEREALPASVKICQVVPAALGERIGDVAAISVAMGFSRARCTGEVSCGILERDLIE